MTDETRDGNPDSGSPPQEEQRPAYGGPPRRRRGRRGYEGPPEWIDKRAVETEHAAAPPAPTTDERTPTPRDERTTTPRDERTPSPGDARTHAPREERTFTPSEPPAEERSPRQEPTFGPDAPPSEPGVTGEGSRRERFHRREGRRGFDRGRRMEEPRRDEPRRDEADAGRREDMPREESRHEDIRRDDTPRDAVRRDERPREGMRRDDARRGDVRREGRRDDRAPVPLPPRSGDEAAPREDRPRRNRDRRGRDRRDSGSRGDTPRELREPGSRGDAPREMREQGSRGDAPREMREPSGRGDTPHEPGSKGDTPRELRRERPPQDRRPSERPQAGPRPPRENDRPPAMPRGQAQARPPQAGARRNDGPRRGREGGGRRDGRGPRPSASSVLGDHPLKPTSVLTLPPKPIRVMIVGGGTGGHITPALSIGEALKARNPQTELLFVGSDRGLEREMIGKAGFRLEEFSLSGLPTRPSLSAFKQAIQVLQAYQRIKRLISEFKPDVVVATGGYVTVPGALAAKTSRVPLVLQEQNSVPGRANRLFSRWASEVHIHFTESRRYFKDRGKLRLSGNPVRIRIPEGRGLKTLQKYRLHPDRKTVLILGGSQGAHSLNQAFIDMLPHFRNDRDVQFVIQTGKQDYTLVLNSVRDSAVRVVVKSFLHQIEEIYGVTSLVLARAGAMTVSEISACGLPSILVPYPYAADDHQTANARALSDKGAAVLLRDADLSGERMAQEIRKLLAEPGRLREMGRFAYSLSRPDAARRIAESVERLGGGAPEAVLNLPEEDDEIEEAEAKH
jgi:UDP-N-acetylglucosamine--N-acetylmuramyl-(pentapeptide) pyrophosphoryl-undecaprenol N-acetylglucosamine transferase